MVGRRAGLLAACLLVGTILAGCSAGNDKRSPEAGAQADFEQLDLKATETTGIIRGIVVDDAVRPLALANVTVLTEGTPRSTVTTADGAFGFDDLTPGTYFLHVTKAGYREAQASTDVVAGVAEPPIVKVLLSIDPASLPYVSSLQYDAFIACSFTLAIVSFAACGLAAEQTNNAFLVNYYADKPPSHIQSEAVWESTQILGNELGLSVTALGPPQVGVNGTEGPSPIYLTINATDALRFNFTGPEGTGQPITLRLFSTDLTGTDVVPEEQVHGVWKESGYGVYNSTPLPGPVQTVFDTAGFGILLNPFSDPDCIKYVFLFNSCMGAGGVGMALQQPVTIFTHIFYGYTPPAGWRFSETGDVPMPPE